MSKYPTKHKRRIYFIDKKTQGSFIFKFVLLSFIGCFLAVLIFSYLSTKKIDSVIYSMKIPISTGSSLLFNELLIANLFVILFIISGFILLTRRIFRQMKPPLTKLQGDIQKIANGDLHQNIYLRENDQFKSLAADINRITVNYRDKFSQILHATQKINNLLQAIDTESGDDFTKQLADLKREAENMEKAISFFKHEA